MENLREKNWEDQWRDYISRSRKLSQKSGLVFFLFGFIEIAVTLIYFIVQRTATNIATFSLLGMFFIVLFLYTIYLTEKKYKGITASFPFFAKRTLYIVFVVIFATPYFILVLFPLLDYFFGNYALPVSTVIFAAEFAGVLILNHRARISPGRAHLLDDESILGELRNAAERLKVPYIDPFVIPGKDMKVANAYCSGFIHHRIWITDYAIENLSRDEIISVIAHEYGHAKYHHNLMLMLPVAIVYPAFFGVMMYNYFAQGLMPWFVPLIEMVAILTPYFLYLPRTRSELHADRTAAGVMGVETTIWALRKLTMLNLILPYRGSMSHPSLESRIRKLNKLITAPRNETA